MWVFLFLCKMKNWIGREFGKLTVVEDTGDGHVLVDCMCGTKGKKVNKNNLHKSGAKSCGGCRTNRQDGMVYGNFKIIKDYVGRNKHGMRTCIAECCCGNQIEISTYSVRTLEVKSCGCMRSATDNTGFKIHDIEIIEDNIDKASNEKKCKIICKCGKEKITSTYNVIYGKIKSCGCINANKSQRLIHDIFENPNKESLYWAGFIAADGCIHKGKLLITLMHSDIDHLIKFKEFVKSDIELSTQNNGNAKCLSISSKKICSDLALYGISSRKTFTYSPPDFCRKSADFWRGMVDGDGYIGKGRPEIDLCGTRDVCEGFMNFAREICKSKSNVTKHGPIFRIRYANESAKIIMNELYGKNPSFYLERKFELFKKVYKFAETDK